ncbi:MAG: ABC transporter permease [Puia sp.]|nr:ABC transporter permease [Puia sp.]
MLKNYIKIAWRNLLKDRQFTLLNLVGLSTGLACVLLIFLWVNDELQVDRFHANDGRLYQVMVNQKNADGVRTIEATSAMLARTLKAEMPEVEYAAGSLDKGWFGAITLSAATDSLQQRQTGLQDNSVNALGHFADKDFFNVFSYPLLQGNKDQVLTDKNSIVISESLARRLFHTTANVVGKTLQWQHDSAVTVSGVFEDVPVHSSDQFDFIVPMDKFLGQFPYQKNWGHSSDPATYVVLKPGASVAAFDGKIAGFMKTKFPESNETLFTRLYGNGYLYGKYDNGRLAGGRIEYVRLFSIIAVFILVIACINFMNLATAKASRRMKEVGIQKVVGATRGDLILQYLGESMLMSCLALLLTIGLIMLVLPAFNNLTGKQLSIHVGIGLIATSLGITALTGVLAGSYPALYISGFRPVAILKGRLKNSVGERWVRRGLVVFQFTLSAAFIIAVMVVYRQVEYIQTKNLGYNKDNILNFDMTGSSADNTKTFLAELRNLPGVINATSLDHSDLYDYGGSFPYIEGKPPKDMIEIHNIGVNYGMIETMGMQLAEGRSFSKNLSSDSAEVILNQAAVDAYGIKDPIGKKAEIFYGDGPRKIVGVVKDFHFQSLHEAVKPFAIRLVTNYTRGVLVKIHAGTEKQTIDHIQALYAKFHPGFPFDYKFFDEAFQAQYVAERRVAILSRWFGGLAILISCLGLFGLAAFTAEKRFKEIGIRKVLGATVSGIAVMLTTDFLKLVGLAILIAFPLAWWATNQWLAGFAYRIRTGPDLFLLAGASTLLITVLTISFQAIKAAVTNPVKSLRAD